MKASTPKVHLQRKHEVVVYPQTAGRHRTVCGIVWLMFTQLGTCHVEATATSDRKRATCLSCLDPAIKTIDRGFVTWRRRKNPRIEYPAGERHV